MFYFQVEGVSGSSTIFFILFSHSIFSVLFSLLSNINYLPTSLVRFFLSYIFYLYLFVNLLFIYLFNYLFCQFIYLSIYLFIFFI